ncbi:DnaJ sub B member 13 [Kappamyces sp. JEL0829]|nr:DnaJ sub B member 13 [Kappamyces sp. JEL0829]
MIIPQDYYQVLSLKRDCQDSDIRLAYRKLALKHHPERNAAPGTKEKFASISEAYHVLSDDFLGFPGGYEFHGDAEAVFNEFFGTKNPFSDFFVGQVDTTQKRSFGKKFGGLSGMATSGRVFEPTQDKPVEFDLPLTLEELYGGALKKIKVTRKILNNDGMSTSPLDKIFTIAVQPGWKNGTKVIFAREGDQGPNKIPADIVFTVVQLKHETFERDGDHLKLHAQVPLVKALVGYSLEVQTLDGRLLRIPVNDTITPEYVKVVAGEGLPNSKTGARGDLLITFQTNFPAGLSLQQKNLLKEAFRQ